MLSWLAGRMDRRVREGGREGRSEMRRGMEGAFGRREKRDGVLVIVLKIPNRL